ncbi:hypothetical protein QJQ45_021437 [Haematococcus lacustris]|nr:hypothetical protein QJQ45_021437 [Haematococcus lacustris]
MAVTDVRNDTLDCPWDVPAEPGSTTFRTGLFRLFQGTKLYKQPSNWLQQSHNSQLLGVGSGVYVKYRCITQAMSVILVLTTQLVTLMAIMVAAKATSKGADQLQDCFNRDRDKLAPYYIRDFARGQPSKQSADMVCCRLTIHSVLWSTKIESEQQPSSKSSSSATAPAYPLTIVTMATQHRLSNLEAQCNSWQGPLTAAVYVPLLLGDDAGNTASLRRVQASTQQLFKRCVTGGSRRHAAATWACMATCVCRMESRPASCALRLLLMAEILGEAAARPLFPINSLRNAALLASDTPLVAMIDTDLLLSSSLATELKGSSSSAAEVVRLCRAGNMLVLPAFEPCHERKFTLEKGMQVADKAAQVGKEQLVKLVKANQMCYFMKSWPAGHGATNSEAWYKSPWPYKVHHTPRYEPWYIVDRSLNPWYDARFRGYGWNKQQQITAAVLGSKLSLMVHPAAYVVHRPHEKSKVAGIRNNAGKARDNPQVEKHTTSLIHRLQAPRASGASLSDREVGLLINKLMEDLYKAGVKRLRAGDTYDYRLDPPVSRCLQELPCVFEIRRTMSAVQTLQKKNYKINQLYVRQDFDECLKLIEEVLRDTENLSEFALFVKALIKRQQGQIQESLQLFQQATTINPHNVANLKQVGRSLYLLGKHKAGIDVYEEASKIGAPDWEIMHNKGLCLMYLKQYERAVECFRVAVDIQPHDSTFMQLGKVAAALGGPTHAFPAATQISTSSSSITDCCSCPQVYTLLEDFQAAIDVYGEALQHSPENAEALTTLGLLYLRNNQNDKAFEHLGESLTHDPKNARTILAAGSIIQDQADMDFALVKYRIAAVQTPNSPQLWNNIGMCFFGKQRYIAAIACLKKALYLGPFEWIISYNLGLVHLHTDQAASAFHYLSASINLKSDFPHSYMYLAVALSKLEDIDNACAAYEKAIQMCGVPGEPVFHLNYGEDATCPSPA